MIKTWNHNASNIQMRTICTNGQYLQKLPVDRFEWVAELSQFKDGSIKNYDEDSNKGYFLEADVENPKKLFSLHSDLPFLPERNKI